MDSRRAGASAAQPTSDVTLRFLLLTLCALWFFSLWLLHGAVALLDETDNHLLEVLRNSTAPSPRPARFILFTGARTPGQGAGNIVSGLLAAHMLGVESGRAVCVSERWTDFSVAFRQRDYAAECAAIGKTENKRKKRRGVVKNDNDTDDEEAHTEINLWSFLVGSADECTVREVLLSDEAVVEFNGNTYPKWAKVEQQRPNLFDFHYEPTPALRSVLPWGAGGGRTGQPPDVVVHLRKGDKTHDRRKGQENATLELLGKTLPRSTFLVTNYIPWYDYYSEQFGWANAGWDYIVHSAMNNQAEAWGPRENADRNKPRERLMLEMWADWYTILHAKEVYHTVSDFSSSAIHWMGIQSKIIMGTTKDDVGGELHLDLIEEAWRRDGEMPRLVDRKLEDLTNYEQKPCYKG